MFNTLIGGLPLAAYGGMFLFLIILTQVLGGLRVINMPPIWHKRLGVIILILSLFHGILAALYFLG